MRLFMQGLRARWTALTHRSPRLSRRGQSLVEMALVMPFLLILLSSMAEFGFAFNRYVNVVEAVREGARFGVDQQPNPLKGGRELVTNPNAPSELMSNMDCNTTQDFYAKISCRIAFSLQPVTIRATEHMTDTAVPNDHYLPADQIIISIARVYRDVLCNDDVPPSTRIPNSDLRCKPTIMEGPDDDPDVDPAFAGLWPWPSYDPAPYEAGNNPSVLFPGTIGHDGSRAGQWRLNREAWRNGQLLQTQFDRAKLQQHLDNTWDPSSDKAAPSQGILLVEMYYTYDFTLDLPWFALFPERYWTFYTYTIVSSPFEGVHNYHATLRVTPVTDGGRSFVEWWTPTSGSIRLPNPEYC